MILFRYLTRELLTTMAAVTLVLLMIMMSGRLIQQLASAAAGEISLQVVFMALVLRMPSFLEMILPMALFISILLAYGRMYAENEMTVLTATGISERRLLGYTLVTGTVVMVLVGTFSLYLSPLGAQMTEDLYRKQAEMTEFELLAPGRFQSMKNGSRVTYTESLSDDKTVMNHVFIADGDTLMLAERGSQYTSPETGSRFLELHNGKRFDLSPDTAALQVLEFEKYGVKIAEESEERRKVRNDAVPTLELFGSEDPKFNAQLQWRFSLIVMVPLLVLIAFPLSKVNPRQGRFARMFPAIILFMVYISLLIAMRGMLEKSKITELGVWSLHALYLVIGLGLMVGPELLRRHRARRFA
ncbi:MAG: LPS export ABC transporter permease LptF [Thalassolituus sp.]